MAHQNAAKCHFHSEQNDYCIQQVTDARSDFVQDFSEKVPALLALKSRGPRKDRIGLIERYRR